MKKIIASIIFSVSVTCLHSQGVIKSIDTKNFPEVSLCVQSYNPDTLAKENIHIFEEGKSVNLSHFDIINPSNVTEKSNILFLWDLRGEDRLVLELLNDYLEGLTIVSPQNEKIKFNVAVFRRDENKEMRWEPLLNSFSSDIDNLWHMVISEGEKELKDYSSSIDLRWTLEQAINLIGMQPVDEAKAIFLFNVGHIDTGIDATHLINIAKERRIQLYIINIDGNEQDENICRNLSMRSYGTFLNVYTQAAFTENTKRREMCPKNENGSPIRDSSHPFMYAESEVLLSLINNLPKRWDGMTYNFSFVSNFEKVGQTKPLKIEIGQDVINISYDIPGFSLGAWIKMHVLWFIIIIVLVVLLVSVGSFFIIRYLRNRAAEKKEAKEKREAERQRLRSEQETLRRKLELAESERIRRQEQDYSNEKKQKRQEYLYSIKSIMRSKNIRLRLLVSTMSSSHEYVIDKPETTLGASDDNDVVLKDGTVSRHHALLYYNGETFGIRDLNSTNGIVMNGFKVKDLLLRNGDTVSLGKTTIKVYF